MLAQSDAIKQYSNLWGLWVKLKASSEPSPVYRRWPLVQKCSRDLFRRRERFHQEMGRETRSLSSLREQHPKRCIWITS